MFVVIFSGDAVTVIHSEEPKKKYSTHLSRSESVFWFAYTIFAMYTNCIRAAARRHVYVCCAGCWGVCVCVVSGGLKFVRWLSNPVDGPGIICLKNNHNMHIKSGRRAVHQTTIISINMYINSGRRAGDNMQ